MRTSRLLAFAVLLAACTQAQRPYVFQLTTQPADPIADVVRALAANGQEAAVVDPVAGIVHTTWQDTGFMFGEVQGTTATIIRRYTSVVHADAGGTIVTLRIDTQRCARGGYEVRDGLLQGRCEALVDIVPDHPNELDRLGAQLQSTLATGMVVVAR